MGAKAVEVSVDTAATELARLSVFSAMCEDDEQLEQEIPRIPTGFARLDAALGGGLAIPSLNVIGAGPKALKSTWAQVLATRHVANGGVAYVLDLENGRKRFLRRLLCRIAEVGVREAAAALRDERAGVFSDRRAAERWRAAKAHVRDEIGPRLFAEFAPPRDFARRLAAIRAVARDRPVLVVVDSLQKLPMDFADRRASTDQWVRLFERLRYELELVFVVISEIKRDPRGGYTAHESAFKESGSIEYSADLAMTLTRPGADEDEEAVSTLRVELARDCDEDPRGDVASYAAVRPHYGLEEREPVERRSGRRGTAKADATRDWLAALLADGPVKVASILAQAEEAGFARATVYRARAALGAVECSLELKKAWRMP
jgi:replicative DNA helicase